MLQEQNYWGYIAEHKAAEISHIKMTSQQNKWEKKKKTPLHRRKIKTIERHKSLMCDLKTAKTIN